MAEPPRETPTEKLRMAFALIDIAERMLRQRLRREAPAISEQALEDRVSAWYAKRPGAKFGDGVGVPAACVDLLFASSGIEPEIVAAAEELAVLEQVTVRVATRAHLIAMKVLARDDRNRPQDFDDLRALLAEATHADIDSAREALKLIEARGFHRGRHLGDDLCRAIADTAGQP